jgi:hypothetical protein
VHVGGGGFVGGEGARPGRGYVSYKTSAAKGSPGPIARVIGKVTGRPRNPVAGATFKAEGMAKGLVPDNTTGLTAQNMRAVQRYVNTRQFRDRVAQTGSAVRRSNDDVLLRTDNPKAPLPSKVQQILGTHQSTIDTLDEQDISKFRQWAAHFTNGHIGMDAIQEAADKHGIGEKAPPGTIWVDKRLLGPLASIPGERSLPGKFMDAVNSGITSGTVYYKPGHAATRLGTNFVANVIQGSARPDHIKASINLYRALSPEDRARALAASGQHGFEAMPHEGEGIFAKVATKGARGWAKYADARFRFNSIAYEARQAGYRTPDEFRHFLDVAQNHDVADSPQEAATVDTAVKRSNREAIAYDRMSPFERDKLARLIWFYAWTSGSTRFLGNTLLEHPVKSGVIGAAGVQGRKQQAKQLGDLPSYAFGDFKVPGGKPGLPNVRDLSTFSPVATPGDLLLAVQHPANIAGMLNPVAGALNQYINSENEYGNKTTTPGMSAARGVVSSTPIAQIVAALTAGSQANRMYPGSPLQTLKRTTLGPWTKRPLNLGAAHKAATKERTGR